MNLKTNCALLSLLFVSPVFAVNVFRCFSAPTNSNLEIAENNDFEQAVESIYAEISDFRQRNPFNSDVENYIGVFESTLSDCRYNLAFARRNPHLALSHQAIIIANTIFNELRATLKRYDNAPPPSYNDTQINMPTGAPPSYNDSVADI
jgi:hypothetical protein